MGPRVSSDPLPRLRALCLALPEVTEKVSHGEPTWFVRRVFVSYADHHHDGRVAFWCAAPAGAQDALVAVRPDRYFRPPYVGGRGWLGVWLDLDPDWAEIEEIVLDAYRVIAPKKLVALLDAEGRRVLPTVAVPGGHVEYEDVPGDPGRAPLLFLHEGLGSVALWRGFHQRIAAATGRRAVAYSRLGHGFSDLPAAARTPEFMHEEAADVLPALCSALGLAGPVLVGHSDGASIALIHAAAHPVRGVVVLAPHVFVEQVGLGGVAAARRAFTEGDLRARMARRHRDAGVTFGNWNDVWLSDGFRSFDLRPLLPAVTAPVLAIQGTDDPYGTAAHVQAVRDAATGPVELLVLDCGHAPHLEEAAAVDDAVLRFLGTLP